MKQIKAIRSGLFKRNTSLLKYAIKSGMAVYNNRENIPKILEELVGKSPKEFADELSQYKGSLTKAGQLISQYGEFYLPKEVNDKLKILQHSTHFLDFEKIRKQIPEKTQSELEINPNPLAAASIGQVHHAKDPKDEKEYVLKIQYQGIEKAIKGDLFFLKIFFNSISLVPRGVDASEIFTEIEKVLKMEMDYIRESRILTEYAALLNDNFYHVPKVNNEYSSDKTLCMEYIEGIALKDIHALNPDQEKLDHLGEKIFELFLREIFIFNIVQTDAHGGNYLIAEDMNRLHLLDFGACLEFSPDVLKFYQNFLEHSFLQKEQDFFDSLHEFMNYSGHELKYERKIMWDYVKFVSDPLRSTDYDWGNTDLPEKLILEARKLRGTLSFEAIPAYFIYLDRKVLGVFSLLKFLGSRFDVKSVFEKVLRERDEKRRH